MNKLLTFYTFLILLIVSCTKVYSQEAISIRGPVESDIRDIKLYQDSIFVVGYEGGVFKKSLSSERWDFIETDFNTNLSFIKSNSFYLAGTVGGVFPPSGPAFGQLYISYNFGRNWEEFNSNLDTCTSLSELFESSNDDVLIGCDSLYKLNKSNSSFINLLPQHGSRVHFIQEFDSLIYSGTDMGIYASNINETSFTLFGLDSVGVFDMSSKNDSIYFATSSGIINYSNGNFSLHNNQSELEFLHVNVVNDTLIVGTSEELYFFPNSYSQPIPIFQNQLSGTLNRLETLDGILFVATTTGIYRCLLSTDTCINLSVPNSFVQSITTNNNGELFSSTFNGIYKYDLQLKSWSENWISANSHDKVLMINDDSLYTTNSSFIFTCGFNSSKCDSVNVDPGFPVFDITIDVNGSLYATSNRKVFKSDDAIFFTEIDFNDKSTNRSLFTIGDSLLFIGTNEALIRKDLFTGDTTEIKFNGYGGGHFANNNDGIIITYASGGLYQSTDYGKNWGKIFNNSNLKEEEFISSTSINDDGSSIFLFTTFNRIIVSNDFGVSWGIFENEFNARVNTSIIKDNEVLFVGTNGAGIYQFNLPLEPPITISNHENSGTFPNTFALHQNYPNPFNPSTLITFDLNKSTHVNISLFNTSGQRIYSKALGKLHIGTYSEKIDLSGYSSGIYFLNVFTESESKTIKMTLIK